MPAVVATRIASPTHASASISGNAAQTAIAATTPSRAALATKPVRLVDWSGCALRWRKRPGGGVRSGEFPAPDADGIVICRLLDLVRDRLGSGVHRLGNVRAAHNRGLRGAERTPDRCHFRDRRHWHPVLGR